MDTYDAWQAIHERASELVDHLLHEQPAHEVDAIDQQEQVLAVVKQIVEGTVKPRDDWALLIRPAQKGAKLDAKITHHFDVAVRQGMFVICLFENDMLKTRENIKPTLQPGRLHAIGTDMLTAFGCAQQHATAWRLLKDVRDKSFVTRSAQGVKANQEIKDEREVLLRGLVKGALTKERPAGGWQGHVRAAQTIAATLFTLTQAYQLPLPDNEDVLSEKIEKLIFSESSLRKAYNESAKEPLQEPVKLRKVNIHF